MTTAAGDRTAVEAGGCKADALGRAQDETQDRNDRGNMTTISERHRHRYEFNREFEEILTAHGLKITGETPDGTYVEICEIEDHPWYLGCQFHPEFKSKPLEPHPLFSSFVAAALRFHAHRRAAEEAPLLPELPYTSALQTRK